MLFGYFQGVQDPLNKWDKLFERSEGRQCE